MKKFFRVDPGKKIQKSEKFFSGILCFEKLEQYLGNLAIIHTSSNLASVPQNRVSRKYFRRTCLAQSQLCILEWFNWAEIFAPSLNLAFMATSFSTFYHFDQPLTCLRPCVRVKRAYLPIYMLFFCWNLKWAHFYECMYISNNAIKWHFVFCHYITVFFWWILYSTICSDDTLYIKS